MRDNVLCVVIAGLMLFLPFSALAGGFDNDNVTRDAYTVAFVVYESDGLEYREGIINQSVASNHTVELIDDDDVGSVDLSVYDVVLWSDDGLQPHIRDLITYKGLNVVLLGDALNDISTIYGGISSWEGSEANATITETHPVVAGFDEGSNAILSREMKYLERTPYLDHLDEGGMIAVGEPNGRVVAVGAISDIYSDGFDIIDNSIRWAAGGTGSEQSTPYSKSLGYIVDSGDDPGYDYWFEGAIYYRLLQDGYSVTPIEDEEVAGADLSSYDVIIEAESYLGDFLSTFVNTSGYNVIALGNGLHDVVKAYGGSTDWIDGETNTQVKYSHPVVDGYAVDDYLTMSSDGLDLMDSILTRLDVNGNIWVGEPNGRIVSIGANDNLYADGYNILENAIEWSSGWEGKQKEGNFSVSASPTTATTSIGGEASYEIRLHNLESGSDTFHVSIGGIDEGWWELSDHEAFLFSGETASIDLDISVPNEEDSAGKHAISIIMESENLQSNKSFQVSLYVDRDPILVDLHPKNGTRSASSDVLFTWRTSVSSSTTVFLRERGEDTFTEYTGSDGVVHSLQVTDLNRETTYHFYVESSTDFGSVRSGVRSLTVENGISFDERSYNVTIDRDYNQITKIRITNGDDIPHRVLVKVTHPYEDLIVDFTGNGTDRTVSMAPGQSIDLTLAMHAQNAMKTDYKLILNLSSISTKGPDDIIYDTAEVNVEVHVPNVDFSMEVIGTDEYTLAKTVRIVNNGDVITDLKVIKDDDLKAKVLLTPRIHNAYLASDDEIEFEIRPVLSSDFSGLSGNISAIGAGSEVVIRVDFNLPEGSEIFIGDADYTVHSDKNPIRHTESGTGRSGSYCTNEVVNDRPFEVPDFLKKMKKLFTPYSDGHLSSVAVGVRGNLLRPNVEEYLEGFSSDNSVYANVIFAGGEYHKVYHSDESGDCNIYYMSSKDGTIIDREIGISGSEEGSRWPMITAQGDNYYIVWVESVGSGSEVYMSKSSDSGDNWSDPESLTDSQNEVDDPFLAIDSDGSLHLVWESIHGDESDILYMNSSDRGSTWSEIKKLSNSTAHSEYPSLSIDPEDHLHLIWEDHVNGNGNILYTKSTDGGTNWNNSYTVSPPDSDAGEPSLAVGDDKTIHVVWRDSRHEESEIYYRNKSENRWNKEIRLTNDATYSEYPCVSIDGEQEVRVTWHDNRTGDDWLYYRKGPSWDKVRRVERRMPNVKDVFLEMSFELRSPESSYVPHDVYLSVNHNQVGVLKDTVPRGKYVFEVDPIYLKYGDGKVIKNSMTTRVEGMNVGHFIVATDYNVVFHLDYVDMPVVAENLTSADEIVKGLTTGTWEGVDPAVYVNDVIVSDPQPTEGESIRVSAKIRNLGEDEVSDVVASFYEGDPDNNGGQIGSDIVISSIGSYSFVEVSVNWTSPGGSHRIYVVIDKDDSIEETDETNNKAGVSVFVWSETPPRGSVLINGGDEVTDSRDVILNLTVGGENPVSLMSLSNDNRTWTDYEEFMRYREWELSEGDGIKTVYVKFMDMSGLESGLFFDDIILGEESGLDENDTDGDGFTDEDERILGTDPEDPDDYPGSGTVFKLERMTVDGIEMMVLARTPGDIVIEEPEGAVPDPEIEGYEATGPLFDVTADEDIDNITIALKIGHIGSDLITSGSKEEDIKLGYYDEDSSEWTLITESVFDDENGAIEVRSDHLTVFSAFIKSEVTEDDEDDEGEDEGKDDDGSSSIYIIFGIVLILILVIVAVVILLKGKTKGESLEE